MSNWLLTISVMGVIVVMIILSLLIFDWLSRNYKTPIFIITTIVVVIHALLIFYLPGPTWTLSEKYQKLDVVVTPPPDSWAGMLYKQDEGLTEDFLYIDCKEFPVDANM